MLNSWKTVIVGCFGAVLFLGVNYSWTHAALAYALNDRECPEGLEGMAQAATAKLFGDATAKPILLCLDARVAGLSVAYGTARFAPLLPPLLVFGSKGQNRDVAAHEFAHAELAARTSVLQRSYRVPTWFDEGLAMQLDERSDYRAQALAGYLTQHGAPETLDALRWPSGFFQTGLKGRLHYALAKCVVSEWLGEDGADLDAVIDRVSWFRPFPTEAFEPYRERCALGL